MTLVLIDIYTCANLDYNFSLPAGSSICTCVSICRYIHREHGGLASFSWGWCAHPLGSVLP